MRKSDIRDAITEAERFTSRAKALLEALENKKTWNHQTGEYVLHSEMYPSIENDVSYHALKESGAVRRASMDLTRSLAHLRRRNAH